jgi:hypothetical protein
MNVWPAMPDAGYAREIWESRLKEAEQARKIRALPRRKTASRWLRAMACLGEKLSHRPAHLQELQA